MKTGIIFAFLLTTLGAWGQGTVYFANRITGTLDAPIYFDRERMRGGGPPGQDWVAQLYLVVGTHRIATGDPIPFRNSEAGAGYWIGANRTLVVPENSVATVEVVVWSLRLGSTFEAATQFSEWMGWGKSAPFEVTTGGGINPPGNLIGLKSFVAAPFPEPSVSVLATTGAAILILGRRKSPRTAALPR